MSTYVPIQTITLSTAAASVTFSGIPQTFADLVVVCDNGNTGGSRANIGFRFNEDSSSLYSRTNILGTGSQALSARFSNESAMNLLGYPASGEKNVTISHILNYTSTTVNKTVLNRLNNIGYETMLSAGLWRNTAAITSIEIRIDANTMPSGSTFTIYGISPAEVETTKASGGDLVWSTGGYWYHAFKTSGTFTAKQNLSCDYIVVAGGGGGAGGYREFTETINQGSYAVTIGAGGAGAIITNSIAGVSGNNTTFNSKSASGGGGGASRDRTSPSANPVAGGSGGGAGNGASNSGGAGNIGGYSPVEGYAGGNASGDSSPFGGAGGGGAAGVGSNNNAAGGNRTGGPGKQWSPTGQYYAGGGGGGAGSAGSPAAGGVGGGGTGGAGATQPTRGFPNSGGGGGGGDGYGASGGSGIVIVRYAV